MSNEDSSNAESIEDSLSWKPPKPTIDLDNINAIEQFLYGSQITSDFNSDCFYDELQSLILDQENTQDDSSSFLSMLSILSEVSPPSSDDSTSLNDDVQSRLEALLEAAGIGKISKSDGKVFADPEILRKLSNSASSASKEDKSNKTESEELNCRNQDNSRLDSKDIIEDKGALHCNVFDLSSKSDDADCLLSLACSSGFAELTEVLLSVPPYAEESTYLTDDASMKLKKKLNKTFLSTLNQQLTKVLLSMHTNSDSYTEDKKNGLTPLMRAASAGHVNIVRLLLARNVNVHETSNNGDTALTFACAAGHVEVVNELLDNEGGTLKCSVRNGWLPIRAACQAGHARVVDILINRGGASVDARDFESDTTALSIAAAQDHTEVVKVLLQGVCKHDEKDLYFSLLQSCKMGGVETTRCLLEAVNGVKLDANKTDSPLYQAVFNGHLEVVKLLIEKGATLNDCDVDGCTFLMLAARQGHTDMIRFLLDKSVDINAKSHEHDTALSIACRRGYFECVRILVEAGAELESSSVATTPLIEAARENNRQIVDYLLSKGVNPLSVNDQGETALSVASSCNSVRVLDCLLSSGSGLEQADDSGRTPLIKAAQSGHCTIVRYLLDKGAFVNARVESNGHTALSLACLAAHYPVVKLLLARGAWPFYRLLDGSSSLLEASKGGSTRIVELFLDYSSACTCALSTLRRRLMLPPSPSSSLSADASRSGSIKTPPKLSWDQHECSDVTSLKSKSTTSNEKRCAATMLKDARGELDGFEKRLKHIVGKKFHPELDCAHLNNEKYVNKALQLFQVSEDEVDKKQKMVNELRNIESKVCEERSRHVSAIKKGEENNVASSRTDSVRIEDETDQFCELCRRPRPDHIDITDYPDQCRAMHVNECTDINQDSSLSFAVAGRHLELARLLISRGADVNHPNKKGYTPLHLAVNEGHTRLVSLLLQAGAHPEAATYQEKETPLTLACYQDNMEIVKVLLDVGANTEHRNKSCYTPISLAAARGFNKLVSLLIVIGAKLNSCVGGMTPLMTGTLNGHESTVELLLKSGVDVNVQNESDASTALSFACSHGQLGIVRLLLGSNANVNHKTKNGLTPLMEVASRGFSEIGKLLLNYGANPNLISSSPLRDSALTIASSFGHQSFCKLLLSRGARVELKNTIGNTALWLACNGGHLDVVKLLVENGADVNEMDGKRGASPLLAAFKNGFVEIVDWLVLRVSRLPSESDCFRIMNSVSIHKHFHLMTLCMRSIHNARKWQDLKAKKVATELLQEVNLQKNRQEARKEKQAKKRRNKKIKRRDRKSSSQNDEEEGEENIIQEDQNVSNIDESLPDSDSFNDTTTVDTHQPSSPQIFNSKDNQVEVSVDDSHLQSSTSFNRSLNSHKHHSKKFPEKQKKSSPSRSTPSTPLRDNKTSYSASKRKTWPNHVWKEVARKCPSALGVKQISIPSRLMSRLIGRAGCNVNTIRDVTGVQIVIENLKKGVMERSVTIKGTDESICQAQQLIEDLISDQSQPATTVGINNRVCDPGGKGVAIQTLKPVVAPAPIQPAWVVPLSNAKEGIKPHVKETESKPKFSSTSSLLSSLPSCVITSINTTDDIIVYSSKNSSVSVGLVSNHTTITTSMVSVPSSVQQTTDLVQPLASLKINNFPIISESSREAVSQFACQENNVFSLSSHLKPYPSFIDVSTRHCERKDACVNVTEREVTSGVRQPVFTQCNDVSHQATQRCMVETTNNRNSNLFFPPLLPNHGNVNSNWFQPRRRHSVTITNNSQFDNFDVTTELDQSQPMLVRPRQKPIGTERAYRRALSNLTPDTIHQFHAYLQPSFVSCASSNLSEDRIGSNPDHSSVGSIPNFQLSPRVSNSSYNTFAQHFSPHQGTSTQRSPSMNIACHFAPHQGASFEHSCSPTFSSNPLFDSHENKCPSFFSLFPTTNQNVNLHQQIGQPQVKLSPNLQVHQQLSPLSAIGSHLSPNRPSPSNQVHQHNSTLHRFKSRDPPTVASPILNEVDTSWTTLFRNPLATARESTSCFKNLQHDDKVSFPNQQSQQHFGCSSFISPNNFDQSPHLQANFSDPRLGPSHINQCREFDENFRNFNPDFRFFPK